MYFRIEMHCFERDCFSPLYLIALIFFFWGSYLWCVVIGALFYNVTRLVKHKNINFILCILFSPSSYENNNRSTAELSWVQKKKVPENFSKFPFQNWCVHIYYWWSKERAIFRCLCMYKLFWFCFQKGILVIYFSITDYQET